MSAIFEIIRSSIEYKNFGANTITASFLATIFLSCFQIRAAIKQNRIIWRNEASNLWTLTVCAYFFFYFLSFIAYGINQKSAAYFFSGLPGLFYIPIIVGIFKFKKIKITDYIASLVLLIIAILMLEFENKGIFVLILFGIGAASLLILGYQMVRKNEYREIEPELLISFFVSAAFWLTYSISIGDRVVLTSSGISMLFTSVGLILYYRWKRKLKFKTL